VTYTRSDVESLLHTGVVMSAWFDMWRRRPVIVESPRPAATVLAQLEATSIRHVWLAVWPRPAQPQICGRIVGGVVDAFGYKGNRNSFRSNLSGVVVATDRGCRFEGSIGWFSLIRVFAGVWIGLVAAGLTISVVAEVVNIALGHWHTALRTLVVVGVLASFAAFFVGLTTVATRLARPEQAAVMRWLADACGVPASSRRV
jgi:hypothetical protein